MFTLSSNSSSASISFEFGIAKGLNEKLKVRLDGSKLIVWIVFNYASPPVLRANKVRLKRK